MINKKKLLLIIIGLITCLLALYFIYFYNYKNTPTDTTSNQKSPTAVEAAKWEAVLPKEEISIEYMNEEDLASIGVSSSSEIKIQVLNRDEAGNVVEYRKINSEQDLIRYRY